MTAFTDAVKSGRSLIFVQTSLDHYKVMRKLRIVNVQAFSTMEYGPSKALLQYSAYLPRTAALVASVPSLSTGVRVKTDRIIWIEGLFFEVGSAEYEQAMFRPRPQTDDRWHFKGDDL